MKFLILASLFVLSVVAEPEPQHHTAGFTAYTNDALVPQDTDSVKAAEIQHLTAKAALYAQPMPLKYYQPHVYGFQHQQLIQVPRVGVYGHHVYQPRVYGLPALRHFGKREAEAEPEAEAEAEAQYLNYYGTPASTYPVTYGYPTAYTGYPAMKVYTGYPTTTAYTGYPATTAYTGYPTTTAYTGYPATTAYKGYPYTYNTLPTTTFNTAYNRYPYTYGYNPYSLTAPASTSAVYATKAQPMPLRDYISYFNAQAQRRSNMVQTSVDQKRVTREAEAEPEADAQFYNNHFGAYTTPYAGFGYPNSQTAYTGYPNTHTAHIGYSNSHIAYTGYPYAQKAFKGYSFFSSPYTTYQHQYY